MAEIIDLSQEIFSGMPVHKSLPKVSINIHATHEEWDGLTNADTVTPSVYKLELSEHTGTHVDALNHMGIDYKEHSIDTMPLSMFYTEGVCVDFSHKGLRELIEPSEMEEVCTEHNIEIRQGDTVLIYTDHYRKAFGSNN